MKRIDWNEEINEWLVRVRNISFEDVLDHLTHDGLLDVIRHTDRGKYPDQMILIVNVEEYACIVPFIEAAQSTMRKDKRVDIRMTERDFVHIQKTALQK